MINGQFQFRRDSAANWTSANPTLASGELGLETDTARFKIGNGTTAWNSLAYGGIKGDTGAAGRGIVSITRTAGNGAAGTTDTYTISYTDSTTSTFTVTNGANGVNGQSVAVSDEGTQLTATASSINFTGTGVTATNSGNAVTVNIPGNPSAATAAPPAVATTGAVGTSADYARADHTHQGVTSLSFNGGTATSGAVSITESAAFATVAVSGQSNVVANDRNGTLTLVAGTGITLATDAAADSVTITGTVSAPQNTFANVQVGTTPTPTVLQADLAADTVTINAGAGIVLTADAATDTMSIANSGVTSVNGQSGAVTIPVATAVTRTSATASASTALTTIQSYPVAAGEIVAGSEYEFYASLRVINTITATNAVVTLSVGATNVLVLTQAIGTTAAAAPGAAVELYGRITFYSATAAEAYIRASKQAAVAFDAVANTSASVTVAAATATTIDLKFNTSGATSTFIARQATIRRVK